MMGFKLAGTACVAAVLAVSVSGCTNYWTSTISRTKALKQNDILVTTADLRAITRTKRGESVTCAEPSPDVAKIAAASLDASASGSASSIGSVVSPEIALTLAMSRSEALAQLGQRLATTQLLRDGMYRACEAYANGAIDETGYAAILGRYDEVMITMLLGEFAANSTTRVLPISMAGNSRANGLASVTVSQEQIAALQQQLTDETAKRDGLAIQLQNAAPAPAAAPATNEATPAPVTNGEATPAPAPAPAAPDTTALKQQLDDSNDRIENLRTMIAAGKSLLASASAGSGTQVANVTVINEQSDRKEIAATMATMQQAYFDDLNIDALMLNCINADQTSPLAKLCVELASRNDILPKMVQAEILGPLLRATSGDPALLSTKIDQILEILKKLERTP